MPNQSDRHVSQALTNLSVAYDAMVNDYVARNVFAVVPVNFKADEYYVYDRADWMRVVAQERAPKTESAGGDFTLATETYNARKYAVHYDVSDDERSNADPATNPDAEATQWVTEQLLRFQETKWATNYFGTGIWGQEVTGVTGAPGATQVQRWDEAASTPIEDIDAGKVAMAKITGRRPNGLLLHPDAFVALKNHPDVIDRHKHTGRDVITEQLLAALFGVAEVLVAWGMGTTTEEGAVTDAFDFLLGKNALLYHKATSPGLRTPSAGYTFAWTGLFGAAATGGRIKRIRHELIEADRIEGEYAWDQKVVAPDLGYFFLTVVN